MRFNILNHEGHSVVDYEPTKEDLARAEAEFERLTREEGRAAFALMPGGDPGSPGHAHELPPDAEEVTFALPIVGG